MAQKYRCLEREIINDGETIELCQLETGRYSIITQAGRYAPPIVEYSGTKEEAYKIYLEKLQSVVLDFDVY